MITLDDIPKLKNGGRYEMSFSGKSTDTEPKKTWRYKGENLLIANASSFFEIDTQRLKFYDEDTESWV